MRSTVLVCVVICLSSTQSIAQDSPTKQETQNFISEMWYIHDNNDDRSKLYFDDCTMIEKNPVLSLGGIDGDKSMHSVLFPINEMDIYAEFFSHGGKHLKFVCRNGRKCIKSSFNIIMKDDSNQKRNGERDIKYENNTTRANWESRIDYERAEKAIRHLQKICKGGKNDLF